MIRKAVIAVTVGSVLAAGCASKGPARLRQDRAGYNHAIVHTANEQMLLNLVRLRYRDTPMFLQVSNISTQYGFAAGAEASALSISGGSDSVGVGASAGYEERPTVSYAPLQGEEFVRQVLAPIPLEAFSLLVGSGWSIERVLRACVQRVNDIPNAPSASGPTPEYAPRFERFLEISAALRRLQIAHAVRAQPEIDATRGVVGVMTLIPEDPDAAAAAADFKRLLGLAPERDEFHISLDPAHDQPGELTFVTRSLMGTLYYLSQGVQVPEEHVRQGWVTVTRRADGTVFDWREVTGGLFEIKVQRERPEHAFVGVLYRDHWFYIDDSDLESKTTFGLLNLLFSLQSGSTKLVSPVLTLPVGR